METVENVNVEDANVNEVTDVVEVCDYNKLGFTDGVKLIGRSIKQNAKKIAIGAGVVTAVGVGALIAHAAKRGNDAGNDDVIDSTARELNPYEDPEVSHAYDNYYEAAEKLDDAIAEFNNTNTQESEKTAEN